MHLNIRPDSPASAGGTPLVRLRRVAGKRAVVLAKVEGRNPAFSVKDRVGVAMIEAALADGRLRPGMGIVEPTSGNTGIALAFAGAARGFPVTLVMPETMSVERRKLLAFLGARLALTPGAEGMAGAIRRAEEIAAARPGEFFLPQQFQNPANPAAHEKTTGPEIWNDTEGDIDVLVSAVGTGGTITGISRYIKGTRGHSGLLTVAVEPSASPAIARHLAGEAFRASPHPIQGIGAGFIPGILDLSLVDRVEGVEGGEALEFARRLAREEGILAGISSGAAVAVAARLAGMPEFSGKTFVVVLPDGAERYMSTALFAGMDGGEEGG